MSEGGGGSRWNFFWNVNAIIATLLAVILLLLSRGPFPTGFWHYVTHEIGFALLVAVIIWLTFEVFLSARAEQESEARIEKIAKSVFLGVFKRNFPEEYIRQANALILDNVFVRRDMELTYTLSDQEYTAPDGTSKTFVLVKTAATHWIKNVGNGDTVLPINIGLPNPMIDELKVHCKVTHVHLKGDNIDETLNLTEAHSDFIERIKNDDASVVIFELPSRTLASGDEIEITFHYTMAKEEEDSEIFQTRFPAERLSVTVIDQGPSERAVRARSIHAHDLENRTPPGQIGTYHYRLNQWLLPRQGFTIWWKKVPARASLRNPPAAKSLTEPSASEGLN